MPFIVGEVFVEKWMSRAERGHVFVDDGDRFISLWIAFNGWMRCKFGEAVKDSTLVNRVKESSEVRQVFENVKNDNILTESLQNLAEYTVIDMRYPNDSSKLKRYDGSLSSLMDVIYQVRCNLFHGRKDLWENEKDYELVVLAYKILLPLFKAYLAEYPL